MGKVINFGRKKEQIERMDREIREVNAVIERADPVILRQKFIEALRNDAVSTSQDFSLYENDAKEQYSEEVVATMLDRHPALARLFDVTEVDLLVRAHLQTTEAEQTWEAIAQRRFSD
jgi:hypothetical protein